MMVLAFAIVVAALYYLHFAFAHRQWQRLKGSQSSEIDMGYVRLEDYLGKSFRLKAGQWAQYLSGNHDGKGPDRNDPVKCIGSLDLIAGSQSGDVLLVEGDLTAGAHITLAREIYIKGDCRIGPSGRLHAAAVDGDLKLGTDTIVARWVDCRGSVDLAAGVRIRGSVTAGGSIRLTAGAEASSLWANEVIVHPLDSEPADGPPPADVKNLILPPNPDCKASFHHPAGFDPRKLKQLGSDTWVYSGDLILHAPVSIKAKLVVRGSFACPNRSVLHDIKASGRLTVGECCRCEGNLFSGADIIVGPNTHLRGLVHAGGTVELRQGVTGGDCGEAVVVYGTKGVVAEEGVTIHGKLASGYRVAAVFKKGGRAAEVETAATPRGMLRARAVKAASALLLLGFLLPGRFFGEDAPLSNPKSDVLPVRVEAGAYGSQVTPGFGNWRGADAQVWLRLSPRFIPAFTVESQTRPIGSQQNYSFFSYLNWTKSFYTVQGVSFAPQHSDTAIYFPKARYDVKGFWKLPPARQFVLAAGVTQFNFGKPGKGQIYNVGALYYHKKLVLEGNLFVNRNQPGNLYSASGTLSLQYGREGSYWTGVTAGGGRELYNYIGVVPFDVRFFSYSIRSFYRKWLSRHWGYAISVLYLDKLQGYRQMGASANLFVEF